jgi:hypothetical protein
MVKLSDRITGNHGSKYLKISEQLFSVYRKEFGLPPNGGLTRKQVFACAMAIAVRRRGETPGTGLAVFKFIMGLTQKQIEDAEKEGRVGVVLYSGTLMPRLISEASCFGGEMQALRRDAADSGIPVPRTVFINGGPLLAQLRTCPAHGPKGRPRGATKAKMEARRAFLNN